MFNDSGTLTADGVTVFGVGTGSVLYGTDPSHEALYLHGAHTAVSGLELTTDAGDRLATADSAAIDVDHISSFVIRNVTVNTTGGAGILVDGADHGTIINNTCRTPTRSRSA